MADLSTVVIDASRQMPAAAPPELTDAQAAVWRDAVASMPGKWLQRASYPLLVEYTRHVCRARLLEAQVAAFQAEWLKEEGGLDRLDQLLAIADRETKAVLACARALRLTPQSRVDPKTAGRAVNNMPLPGPKLWDP